MLRALRNIRSVFKVVSSPLFLVVMAAGIVFFLPLVPRMGRADAKEAL